MPNKTLRDIIASVYITGSTGSLDVQTATATDMIDTVVDTSGASPVLRVSAASASGATGTSGTSGVDGTSGIDGLSGSTGVDGTSGSSGVDGTSGTSGGAGGDGTFDNLDVLQTLEVTGVTKLYDTLQIGDLAGNTGKIILGAGSTNTGTASTVIGNNSTATHRNCVAIGYDNDSLGNESIMFGHTNTSATHKGNIIGHNNSISLESTTLVVGNYNTISSSGTQGGYGGVTLGYKACSTLATYYMVSIGVGNVTNAAFNGHGQYSLNMGVNPDDGTTLTREGKYNKSFSDHLITTSSTHNITVLGGLGSTITESTGTTWLNPRGSFTGFTSGEVIIDGDTYFQDDPIIYDQYDSAAYRIQVSGGTLQVIAV